MTYEVKVRPEKIEAVQKIKGDLDETSAVLLTEYRGLGVTDLAVLRSQLGEAEVTYRVVKNTLARRAVSEAGFPELEGLFTGPTALAYCKGDPVAAARVLAAFAKAHPALVLKGGVLDGRVLTAEETQRLTTVDVLDVSRAKIVGQLTAGLSRIASLLEAPLRQMLFVLEELAKREPQAPVAVATEEPGGATEPEAAAETTEPEAAAETTEPGSQDAPTEPEQEE